MEIVKHPYTLTVDIDTTAAMEKLDELSRKIQEINQGMEQFLIHVDTASKAV